MTEIFKQFLQGIALLFGVVLGLYFFSNVFNMIEKHMLSQNCDTYFEVLYEQKLVPMRCYKEYGFYSLPEDYKKLDCDVTEKIIINDKLSEESCL